MEFKAIFHENIIQSDLVYSSTDYSFDMIESSFGLDYELILNDLSLSVFNEKIVKVWGFCGLNSEMVFNGKVPQSKKGSLVVVNESGEDLSYFRINHEPFPVHINFQTEWICIGDPIHNDDSIAVEFIKNCIAVINSKNKLTALWLKPEPFPELRKSK